MTQAQEPMALPPRRGPKVKGRYLVVAVALFGVVMFLLIVFFIWLSRRNEPYMDAPPVGAGAGETGMYNQHMGKQRQKAPAPPP